MPVSCTFYYKMQIMWLSVVYSQGRAKRPVYFFVFFALQNQMHALHAAAVLCPGGHDIDAGGIHAAVPQQVGQLHNVVFQRIERACK